MATCADWRRELPDRWDRATEHPFLTAVAAGDADAFARWLPQDAIFVADLVSFQARLLARAPRSGQRALAAGLVGLVAELDWFDEVAEPLGIDTGPAALQAPLPATLAYRSLLGELDAADYPAALLGLWVLERVYLEAWRFAGRGPVAAPHRVAVEHWTDPGFATYVDALEEAADVALAEDEGTSDELPSVVRQVLDAEIAFWDMALSETAAS
jgi:thiaminase/transcriptional activator TenA